MVKTALFIEYCTRNIKNIRRYTINPLIQKAWEIWYESVKTITRFLLKSPGVHVDIFG